MASCSHRYAAEALVAGGSSLVAAWSRCPGGVHTEARGGSGR